MNDQLTTAAGELAAEAKRANEFLLVLLGHFDREGWPETFWVHGRPVPGERMRAAMQDHYNADDAFVLDGDTDHALHVATRNAENRQLPVLQILYDE